MNAATKIQAPAPASAEARATKIDRVKYLENWSIENPLATIEAAREAVRKEYGISLGTKIISDTLRMARQAWEDKRREAMASSKPMEVPGQEQPKLGEISLVPTPGPQAQIAAWAHSMKAAGIRLLEILDDGRVRVEYVA